MTDIRQKTVARGRPRRTPSDTAQMRDRIKRAARDLFARDGYEGVSMRKLAAAAGCAPAALYAYFPNKRAVLRVLWEDIFGELGNELRQAIATHHDPLAQLHTLMTTTIRFWLERPDDFRAIFLIQDEPQGPDGTYFADEAGAMSSLGLIREVAGTAVDAGLLRIHDPDRITSICIASINGTALNLITIPEYDWGETQAVIDDITNTIIDGLKSV
ncbi:Transcriptional regulator, TetR family [Candidatus Phaeomarinobacter ectocarpi]|uniref:Transcriptional regulator, TetR family n=1 Tax=Candidatus Phaeomarinibacter ectocarpi TaxID=1458461 RepID=X5MLZ3_9HYPH|nr:TetR/AcrR family transcriptional regulator [Candidatus Phaeomarinobacter ectocarpi]CDO58811.1 Transcriptional regulator, TetR family [Candidatus Phaeomarinobacter ectocarpi]